MMKTIYLIRHAESLANSGAKSLPDRDIPLSEQGQRQAQRVIPHLPLSQHVFTSEFVRTQQTAQPYLQHYQLTAQILPDLNEFSYLPLSLIDGLNGEQRRPISQAYWQRANPLEKCGENTDSFAEFNQRIEHFLHKAKTLPDQSLCFTHGIWIALLVWRLLGFSANTSEDMQKFRQFQPHLPMPNTAIWRLNLSTEQTWQISSFT
ncbi:histidine phosphatase family protein [Lonepinella sp. BR2271]|uniref:histidine phosphatase family protein n=1 Tax=Lonepinella sp. BR2271 TaxID=3434550 RepID=UPI003F6DD38A